MYVADLLSEGKIDTIEAMMYIRLINLMNLSKHMTKSKKTKKFTDEDGNIFCHVSDDKMAKWLNVSARTIIRTRKKLKDKNLIDTKTLRDGKKTYINYYLK